jgi:hypothetical protein
MTGRNDSLCEDRDFAGGGRGGCVQIILCPSHLMPIDKLWCDVNGEVASSGQRGPARARGKKTAVELKCKSTQLKQARLAGL